VDKTLKRAISLPYIKKIKNLKFPEGSTEELAKDIFMFSFYTRGMSFIDISYLQKKDLKNGILTYRRRKTGQILFIRWEPCMEDIVNKYFNPDSPYLLPIITAEGENGRKQYILKSHKINEALKRIGKKINLETPLTMYVARHSWASIAQHKRIPLSVISKGMGHDSEETTRIYLNSIDNNRIDRANSMILKSL
jgi:integrase